MSVSGFIDIPTDGGSGTSVTDVTATSPLFSSGGTTPNITIQKADGSHDGYLSAADWTHFNSLTGGDVVGPSSSVDNTLPRFDGITGKLLQDSSITVGDNGFTTWSGTDGTVTADFAHLFLNGATPGVATFSLNSSGTFLTNSELTQGWVNGYLALSGAAGLAGAAVIVYSNAGGNQQVTQFWNGGDFSGHISARGEWTHGFPFSGHTFHSFYKDINAGDTTEPIYLQLGNSGSSQGLGYFSYGNDAAVGSPFFDLAFTPRNNTNSGVLLGGLIRMQKTATNDGTNIYISTSDTFGVQRLAMTITPNGDLELSNLNELRFQDAVGGQFVGFVAPATVTGGGTYVLPESGPPSNQVLQSDSSKNLSWVDQTALVTPGGAFGSVQWNNAGAFDGFGTTDGNDVSFPNNVTVANGLITSANLINHFMVNDGTNQLISYVGWNTTAEGGQEIGLDVDEANANFIEWDINLVPTAPSTGLNRHMFELNTQLDPTNTGFQIGDNTGNGGVTLFNLDGNHQSSGQVGYLNIINGFTNLGDGTLTGKMARYTSISRGCHVSNAYSLDNYLGMADFPNFDVGSTVGTVNGFNFGAGFNGAITGFASAAALFANFGASSVTAHYHGIENGVNGTAGAVVTDYIGYNSYANNIIATDFVGGQFTPSGSSATNVTGWKVDLGGVSSPNQKIALTLNDGSFQANSNFDTSVLPASPGFFNFNGIGGLYHVAAGFPTTNTLILANNIGISTEFEDDMGPDAFGGFLGFVNVAAVNQLVVAVGKTVSAYNNIVVGSSIPGGVVPTDGGTITSMSNILAIGALSQGGSVIVDNLYGLNIPSFFSSLAVNAWGAYVADTNANNWFAKNVIIGGATGLPIGAFQLDVTGNGSISGDLASATLTPANGATGTFTTVDLKTVTVTSGIIVSIL